MEEKPDYNKDNADCGGDGMTCRIRPAEFDLKSERKFLSAIRKISELTGVHIICFNADLMAGISHVKAALRHAERSFFRGSPIANSFEMEALLYAGGTRQCQEAAGFGIHKGSNRCYICFCPDSTGADEAVSAMEEYVSFLPDGSENGPDIGDEKMKRLMDRFEITPEEISVVGIERFSELVLERVALLDVYR